MVFSQAFFLSQPLFLELNPVLLTQRMSASRPSMSIDTNGPDLPFTFSCKAAARLVEAAVGGWCSIFGD